MEMTRTMSHLNNGTIPSEMSNVMCVPNRINSNGIYSGDSPFDFSVPLLLSQVSVVMIVTNIVRFLLRPLNLPIIMSDIIGGILIGPSGLGRNKQFRDTVFPCRGINELNIGAMMGVILFLFLMGVKQDCSVIVNSGKKSWIIAVSSTAFPLLCMSCSFIMAAKVSNTVSRGMVPEVIVSSYSITAFTSLHPILVELNLLNSKLGRLAMSASTNIDVLGWIFGLIFGALNQGLTTPYKAFCFVASVLSLYILIFFIIRPLMFHIIHRTPEGRPVNRSYIIAILMGVFVLTFIGDMVGLTVMNTPWILGLAIPDGPPLGTALVDKTETIIDCFFRPIFYAFIGLKTNVFAIKDWTAWGTLQGTVLLGYFAKVVGTMLPSRYFKIPFHEALSLGLIMNLRGIVEFILLVHLSNYKVMDEQSYTTMILATVAITAIAAPTVRWLSRNSKLYTPYGLRTIEHSKPNRELRILVCIHSQDDVPTMLNLVEASNATTVRVWNLNLVELLGRAVPMLISHNVPRRSSYSTMPYIKQINKAFQKYEEESGRWVSVQSYTSVSPYKTMHQDICMLALDKKTSLIILPFCKQQTSGSTREPVFDRALRMMNSNVLDEAPCSVGILVDHGQQRNLFARNSSYRVCMIFLGGADDREALAYGALMVGHPRVWLDVVRIQPNTRDETDVEQSEIDDKFVALFRIKCTGNPRMSYREERVNDCEETINVIRYMEKEYNLILVGRQHESKSILVKELCQWCENPELGVIGDFIACSEFSKGRVSVLVVQQQINVGLVVLNGHQILASQIGRLRTTTVQ